MAFKPGIRKPGALPDFDSLKATFLAAKEQIENYTLYQTIIRMMESSQQMRNFFSSEISELEEDVAGITDQQLYVPMGAGGGLGMEKDDKTWLLIPIDRPDS